MEVSTKSLGKQLAAAEEINAAIGGALPGKVPGEESIGSPMSLPDIPDTTMDSAELSNDSLSYSRDKSDESQRQLELERIFEETWKLLEEWRSAPGMNLMQELQKLKEIYQQLLQDIMKFYPRDQIEMQADRVNALLLEIIDQMGNTKFPCLLSLLDSYGRDGAGDALRASIIQKATGRAVSPREIASARAQDINRPDARMRQQGMNGCTNFSQKREDGILYDKGKGNQINANQRYQEHVRKEELFQFRSGDGIRHGHGGSGGLHLSKQNYTVSDIECSEQFLHYFHKQGNLFSHPQLTAGNEEFLGFLMALSMMKLRIFADYSNVGKGMASDVRVALERLFQYQLEKNMETCQRNEPHGGTRSKPDRKAIHRVYCHIMEIMQHTKGPGKGLTKGLQYAWETFFIKKEDPEYQECRRYHPNAGFFTSDMEDADKVKDFRHGARLLDRDWQEFLASIGQDQNSLLQIALSNSLWGMMIEPEGASHIGSSKSRGGVIFWGLAGVFLLVLLIAACLRITLFLP